MGLFLYAWLLAACGGTLDAGSDKATDVGVDWGDGFPVGPTTPVILSNDGPVDNWQGEYGVLFAAGGLALRGVAINDSDVWPDITYNLEGWQALWDAAAASGVQGLPELTSSPSPPLSEPASGQVDDTVPNYSAGAQLIVREAMNLDPADLPLAVVTGGRLTDAADAYLIEPEIAERIIVVAALGEQRGDEVVMAIPNGDLDTWATVVVAERLHFALVTDRYEQRATVTDDRLGELPQTPLGDWISGKSARISVPIAADQVALLAGALPNFAQQIDPVTMIGTSTEDFGDVPALAIDPEGSSWVITAVDGDLATRAFWELLD